METELGARNVEFRDMLLTWDGDCCSICRVQHLRRNRRTCQALWEGQAFFPYVDSASASSLGVLATPVAGTRDGN